MAADIWFLIVVLGLMLYVALDGYDLGMGILALTRRSDNERRALLELVSPVWDGNESWILLVAVGLWGGFPAATGALLPAVYLAVIVMVFSLIARGVSIEMVSNAQGWTQPWGMAFMVGSLCAAFAQGVVVGAVVHGIPLGPNAHFAGSSFDFLSGYSVLTGLTAVALYTLAGAAAVKMRSNDATLRNGVARWGRSLVPVVAALVALSAGLVPVAGASGLTVEEPLRIVLLAGASVTATAMLGAAWWSFGRPDHDNLAFVGVALAIVVGIAGLAVILYPFIIPPSLTIARAASPSSSLEFLLGGVGMLVPLVIAYNAYAFWVLRPRRTTKPKLTAAAEPAL
jgi:cytochrome d ubiquinol oxidase subunit II